MELIDITSRILSYGYVCDHCLGRQFSQVLSGYSNKERGSIIRTSIAIALDCGGEIKVNASNLSSFKFRNYKLKAKKSDSDLKCVVCNDIFKDVDTFAQRIIDETKNLEFSNFLIGVRLSDKIRDTEEVFWESVGIDFCESIKNEISREVGKRFSTLAGKEHERSNPDIAILIDLEDDIIEVKPNPIYIYGKYKKLVRGIPQTKWPCRKCRGLGCDTCDWTGKQYPESVEELIAAPVLEISDAMESKFHGAGREDIDALNLAGRPFIVEMKEPQKRSFDLKALTKTINKATKDKVEVSDLRFSNKAEVVDIKANKSAKTYRAMVELDSDIKKEDVKKISELSGKTINQRTPERVSHRRADLIRKRNVISINAKFIDKTHIEVDVKGDAGLYIKELISGDNDRTKPSVTGLLGVGAKVIELDVIQID
ncbi:MAG: tRNA pseudouridine(54/55) synthase Pus10 [DPANN group archaeon]|nr:tRNA pseudouridine(54/55) synthase Pus10 [DPANN group archaeon]